MQAEEYEQAVARATLPALVLAHQLLSAIRPNPMSDVDWLAFLQGVYDTVREGAWQAAQAARAFYDAERSRQIPGVPPQPVKLAQLSFENFVRDMEPARKIVAKPDFSPDMVAMRVARSVENGARRTVIRAVEDPDPDLDPIVDSQVESEPTPQPKEKPPAQPVTQLVRGWARVPTGRETCGFCWMLASRGPVYNTSGSGGGKVSQAQIIRKTADGSMSSDDMNQWHPGCDCKIVPVFRLDNWSGKDKADAAWQLWEDEIQGRYSGRDALNAYRRLVEDGAIQRRLSRSRAA